MIRTTGVVLFAALLGGTGNLSGAELKLFGSIQGQVRNGAGVGQMGASVFLMNRYERIVQRVLTAPDGHFRFDALTPDNYSVRVSLSSFVPAMRSNIPVRAGFESFLNIQLATLFSSIELVYSNPTQTGLLSDDWKWTLRSSTATRPVLRFSPNDPWLNGGATPAPSSSPLAATSGLVRVSAGDQGLSSSLGSEADLGTAFALATSLFGSNVVKFSGNFGYAPGTNTPTTGFRTSYSRHNDSASAPNVELTVRQAAMRQRAGQGFFSGQGATPTLRTMSVKVSEKTTITDAISLEYGAVLESVVFIEHLNLFSPFARMTYDLGRIGQIEAGFSSGAPALDLIAHNRDDGGQEQLLGLAMFPRVSLNNGRARVQRNETFELGYRRAAGSRTYAASVYQDFIRDAAVTFDSVNNDFGDGDRLPDLASRSSIFNMGNYKTIGYSGSVTQNFHSNWNATVMAGATGMMSPGVSSLETNLGSELRHSMRPVRKAWASARVMGQMPASGTRLTASYVWTPDGTLGPTHAYLTQTNTPQLGLNFQVHQPIPAVSGIPGRLEMNAELRNLLAQGYVPIASADGSMLLLIQFPRSFRGGVSFIF
ncbi:TonB-dependent receptor [Paludibaculum fermentans]|uniref:Carboxypeptidase regulatory-like domain-containing protein n=1 Tax=Paludibaculum fermentans TaxID=1473598 RepID=A0A7S7SLG0_PALFE|nr:carboxypeptidase-like regulatory domain-containing protein [Paludibaculum fermentans]QOY89334.1 carboxypeptidase regulatory-like domain-containing protein [Paludibaculum fermentans]